MTIGIKDAVKSAREQALQLFEEETLNHLALEEVEFDEATQHWLVTLGYDSPHKLIRKTTGSSLFPTIEEAFQTTHESPFQPPGSPCPTPSRLPKN